MGLANTPSDPLGIVKAALLGYPNPMPLEDLAPAIREVHERLRRARRECPTLDLSDDVLRLAAGLSTP